MVVFSNRSKPRYPTIRQALVTAGLSTAGNRAQVAVLEKHGQYAGRRVNFFRAFEPGHQDVLLGSGHVERDGLVIVNYRSKAEGATPARQPANRAEHADDERLVFWNAEAARSSVAPLSEAAATWQRARTSPNPTITA